MSIGCGAHTGNLNPAATPGASGKFDAAHAICTATAGRSGGSFDITKTYAPVITSSAYAGNHWGSAEFLVSE
jgi:hypothetical protein